MSYITKTLYLVLVLLCVQTSYCHTYLSSIILNNEKLSEGDCVRPHPQSAKEYPLPSVTVSDMTCGWLPEAAKPANRKCPIAAGSKIGVQWYHSSSTDPSDFIIEATHKGPITFYLANSETGSGNVWFKIYEDGYTASDGKWAVDRLLANGGRVDVTIPIDVAPGNYLLRGEVLALHNAYDVGGIQPYVGCVELTISGSGSATPQGVAFPGAYTPTSPGMVINIYQPYNSYPIPGPALYVPGSVAAPTSAPTLAPTVAPTVAPTAAATVAPTASPTKTPTVAPTAAATSAPTLAPTSAPTVAPTVAPTAAVTSAPTSAPTAAATVAPTHAPTNAPTTAPASAPTTRPTSSPSSTDSVKVGLNDGSSNWWIAAIVSGGGETTVKVEIMDSGSLKSWTAMTDMSFSYVYTSSSALVLPLSLRLTSSSGKQVVLTNVFTSLSTGAALIDTGKTYSSSSTSVPTSAPATAAPTSAPTNAPSSAPATSAPTTAPTNAPSSAPTKAPTSAPSSGSGCDASSVVLQQVAGGSWDFNGKTIYQYNLEISHTCSGKNLVAMTLSAASWNPINAWNIEGSASSLSIPSYVVIPASSTYGIGYQNVGGEASFTITSVTFQ